VAQAPAIARERANRITVGFEMGTFAAGEFSLDASSARITATGFRPKKTFSLFVNQRLGPATAPA